MKTIHLAERLAERNASSVVKVSTAGAKKFRVPQVGNLFAKPG